MKKLDKAEIDNYFDTLDGTSFVYLVNPNIFKDDRGWFMERMQFPGNNFIDIKQINRSCSRPGVIRGCHAQKGPYCQAKLVEAVNTDLVDVITDARPASKTFGKSKMYLLSSAVLNMLYVPHGFLHAFVVPLTALTTAYFNYYCDNRYDKESEVCVNPIDIILPLVDDINWNDLVQVGTFGSMFDARLIRLDNDASLTPEHNIDISKEFNIAERDRNGLPLEDFLAAVKDDYNLTGKNWYD